MEALRPHGPLSATRKEQSWGTHRTPMLGSREESWNRANSIGVRYPCNPSAQKVKAGGLLEFEISLGHKGRPPSIPQS